MLFTMVKTMFKIRGLAAELHVFEYGGTTFGTFGKLAVIVEDFYVKTIGWGLKNHVFDHETRKREVFPCYRLKINDFLSSYNQKSQNRHFHTPAANSLLHQK